MNLHSIALDELDLVARYLTKKFSLYTFTVRDDRKTIYYTDEAGFRDTLSDYSLRVYITEMHAQIERGKWTP